MSVMFSALKSSEVHVSNRLAEARALLEEQTLKSGALSFCITPSRRHCLIQSKSIRANTRPFIPTACLKASSARVVQPVTGLAGGIDDILRLHVALQPEVRLLVTHDRELDVGLEYAHQPSDLGFLILSSSISCDLVWASLGGSHSSTRHDRK